MKTIGLKIILEIENEPEQTKAGLIVPKDSSKDYKIGTVVTTGPGEKDSPILVKEGDKVYVKKMIGTEIKIEDKKYLVIHQNDILAIM